MKIRTFLLLALVIVSNVAGNFALSIGMKGAPALAAGNTVVIKPSEQTPLTTLLLARVAAEIFPKGVLNVITGRGPSVGQPLVEHPKVAMVSLTGDVATGRIVRTLGDTKVFPKPGGDIALSPDGCWLVNGHGGNIAALDTILTNIDIAEQNWQPMCQDTGTPLVWIHHPAALSAPGVTVAAIFTPGASTSEIVDFLRSAVAVA